MAENRAENLAENIDNSQEGGQLASQKEEHQPSEKHPRFKQVYRDNKVKERTIEEQNLQIEELLMNARRVQVKLDDIEGQYKKDKVASKLSKVETGMRKAVEDGDVKLFDNLTKTYKETQQEVHAPKNPSADPGVDLAYFKPFNPWYETDSVKTRYAISIDSQLRSDPAWGIGSGKTNVQFLAEVARRTNDSYGSGFETYSPTAGVNNNTFRPKTNASDTNNALLTNMQKGVAEKLFDQLSKEEAHKKYASGMMRGD